MKRAKQEKLQKRGWAVGTVADFLALTPEEAAFVEIKLALSDALRTQRQKANLSQAQVAKQLGSSQSRVAKMETGDPSVTLDLLVRSLLVLGVHRAATRFQQCPGREQPRLDRLDGNLRRRYPHK